MASDTRRWTSGCYLLAPQQITDKKVKKPEANLLVQLSRRNGSAADDNCNRAGGGRRKTRGGGRLGRGQLQPLHWRYSVRTQITKLPSSREFCAREDLGGAFASPQLFQLRILQSSIPISLTVLFNLLYAQHYLHFVYSLNFIVSSILLWKLSYTYTIP